MRSADDLPAPFGPSSVITWPVATAKLILRNTRRPARSQVKSCTWTGLGAPFQPSVQNISWPPLIDTFDPLLKPPQPPTETTPPPASSSPARTLPTGLRSTIFSTTSH